MSKAKILFLSTDNSARSQMGEAFIGLYAGDYLEPYSAGTEPKGINPYTVRVLEERGISLAGHTSEDLSTYLGQKHFGYVVTVCANAEKTCPRSWLLAQNHTHWNLDDPAQFEGSDAEKMARFREIRDEIDERIQAWLVEQDVPGGVGRPVA